MHGGECSLLGLTWNKNADRIGINIPAERSPSTKRGVLGKVARIYDPLGLVSPFTLGDKLLYREVCDAKIASDAQLQPDLVAKWTK